MTPARFLPLVLLLAAIAGCGSAVQEGTELTVYVSAPTSGAEAEGGRAVVAGAEQALADAEGEAGGAPVRLEALDAVATGEWTQASVAANARLATQDSTAIAYIGDSGTAATRASAPITNEAGMLQVAPYPLARELLAEAGGNDVPDQVQTTGERTLGTVLPTEPFNLAVVAGPGQSLRGLPPYDWGYEAMAATLDAIDRAEDPLSRSDVVAAFMATTDRASRLGTYSIGPSGAAEYSGEFEPNPAPNS